MWRNKLTIPKVAPEYTLYIYRSRKYKDVSTIAACRKRSPIIKIDQNLMPTVFDTLPGPNGTILEEYHRFEFWDRTPVTPIPGFEYFGPEINNIPNTNFELVLDIRMLNQYTFHNYVILKPLPIDESIKNGYIYYYSALGVKGNEGILSHITTQSILTRYPNPEDINYMIYTCDDYNDSEDDIWNYVTTIPSVDEDIKIGTYTGEYTQESICIPVVETVPEIDISEVSDNTNSVLSNNFMTLSIINPWQANNERFNFRKLKSFKVMLTCDNQYSDFSEPTYQSTVPVSIEKMVIYMQIDPEDESTKINYNDIDQTDRNCLISIRKNGLYYDESTHKSLGFNLYNVPSETRFLSVYSEGSVNDKINYQIPASAGHTYTFDIYLVDVYEKPNNGIHYIIKT